MEGNKIQFTAWTGLKIHYYGQLGTFHHMTVVGALNRFDAILFIAAGQCRNVIMVTISETAGRERESEMENAENADNEQC